MPRESEDRLYKVVSWSVSVNMTSSVKGQGEELNAYQSTT